MGWDNITIRKDCELFKGISRDTDFYFVHSYHFNCKDENNVLATTDYGYDFTSAVVKKNVLGTQFHPEKSQANGLKLLENFCEWDGK